MGWICHYEPDPKRQFIEWLYVDSSVKKKFCEHRSVKKVILTVSWDMKGLITVDFHKNGTIGNSASYCQIIKKYFTLFIE